MDKRVLRENAEEEAGAQSESADRAGAYPFPTADTGPTGPQAATSIHLLDDSPGARADGTEARAEDLHEGSAQRARGDAETQAIGERTRDGQAQARVETEERVASAWKRRRDAYAALSGAAPDDIKSVVIAAGGGFLLGAWWARGRR